MTVRGFRLELDGRPLHGRVDLPALPGARPTILVCHGFKGFMDWGFFPTLAALLAERGFVVVRFNFSGGGMQPGDDLVSDLDAFRENTFSRELAETLAVLDRLAELAPGRADPGRVGLFGHSRGGGIAVLAAAHPTWRHRLRALVTWAAVATFERASEAEKETWRRDGVLTVVNTRTGQRLPLGVGLLQDYEAHREELDVLAAAGRRTCPWLIVHGEEDESVPVDEARRLAAAAAAPRELLLVPGGSHTFGARHPFAGPTPQLIQALNATQAWFREHLAGEG